MRVTHRLSGKILTLVGTGILVPGLFALLLLFTFSPTSHAAFASRGELHPFTLTSPDFRNGGALPQKNSYNQSGCTGSNIAPTLNWSNVPAGTQSLVMLMSDSDAPAAGGFYHWVVYNIPANAHQLEGNHLFTEGINNYGNSGYGGPCPPSTSKVHHYLFVLYATDIALVGGQGLKSDEVVNALQGHVLGTARITGTFHLP